MPADATIWKYWWLGEVIGKSETGGIWKKHEQKLDINILEFLGAKLGLFSSSKMIETLSTLKVVSVTFLLVCFLSLNESTCQTRKNVFYFTSKALFVLKKIKF